MNLKENINKLHGNLSNAFSSVVLEEKSSQKLGNYIEISLLENNKNLLMIISKLDLENDRFNWKYYSNPNDKNSILVERTSNISDAVNDVKDIFEKNRFDSDYIESIK